MFFLQHDIDFLKKDDFESSKNGSIRAINNYQFAIQYLIGKKIIEKNTENEKLIKLEDNVLNKTSKKTWKTPQITEKGKKIWQKITKDDDFKFYEIPFKINLDEENIKLLYKVINNIKRIHETTKKKLNGINENSLIKLMIQYEKEKKNQQ